jgi:hypothetical protein
MSENRICYDTVEKTKDGLKARRIEREGPTGLITTTTAVNLHPENETRLISLTVEDTQEQTKAIMRAQAERQGRANNLNLAPWHALQQAIALGPASVAIPFARELADLIPPVAVRLRRDYPTLLALDLLPDFVKQVRAVKLELIVALTASTSESADLAKAVPANDVLWWQRRFTVRTFEWLRGNRNWQAAKRLAWGDLQNDWHGMYSRRWPTWQCAGCEGAIGGLDALNLPDGNRVHREPIACLIAFGNRWRSDADDGLVALGLQAPEGTPSSAMKYVTSTITPVLAPAQVLRKDDP